MHKLRVKLSTAVDTSDAHAIDIKYHKTCWATNVTNVLPKPQSYSVDSTSKMASEMAGKVKFLTMTEIALREGKILTNSSLQTAFDNILEENNVAQSACDRKVLKQLLKY